MQKPSIQELASRARDVAKYQNIPMREAIHSVAEEYDTDPHLIACELSQRGCAIKKKKAIANKKALEIEQRRAFEELRREKILHDAHVQEHNYLHSFILAGHIDDY